MNLKQWGVECPCISSKDGAIHDLTSCTTVSTIDSGSGVVLCDVCFSKSVKKEQCIVMNAYCSPIHASLLLLWQTHNYKHLYINPKCMLLCFCLYNVVVVCLPEKLSAPFFLSLWETLEKN